ncbi:MAG TPA: Gfo/Idh/MocA family oxidoreductase [Candidatus Acidoferrum sp.]|nr:Gfo/Idh/MocA family oxidoreductase [Candidatus Acidoferrum sp.]
MNRRDFLKGSAAASFAIASTPLFAAEFADMKKRVGLIGTGWYGKIDLLRLIQIAPVEVVSLCDVDKTMLSNAADIVASRQKSGKKPRTYSDYREMLKEKDLDVVLVGTPDHWHALPMIEAVKSGADVYCQKPISIDIAEGQSMLAAARKYNRVVQIGTQRRSTPHLIEARDRVIKAGLLGKISHVEICCYYHMRSRDASPASGMPPANLDYEFWLGPAPQRPYHKIMHPRSWRAFMEFSNGIVGDMCVHMLDMTRWMLELGMPTSVSSAGGIFMDKKSVANTTDTQTATFEFPELNVVWTHRSWGDAPDAKYPWAAIFYGEKGTLKASVNAYEFFPRGKLEPTLKGEPLFEYEKFPEDKTEKDLERHVASAVRWHMQDMLRAIEARSKPVADIEQGYISTAACILANLSAKLGRSLKWDHAAGKIVGDDEANKLLRRESRAPWQHPASVA